MSSLATPATLNQASPLPAPATHPARSCTRFNLIVPIWRWLSRYRYVVILNLMILLNVFMAWIQLIQPLAAVWTAILRYITAAWFTLASVLICMANIDYFFRPSPPRSNRFATMLLTICLTFAARFLHHGAAPPLIEWPYLFDWGLLMGWGIVVALGGGGPFHLHRRAPHQPRQNNSLLQSAMDLANLGVGPA